MVAEWLREPLIAVTVTVPVPVTGVPPDEDEVVELPPPPQPIMIAIARISITARRLRALPPILRTVVVNVSLFFDLADERPTAMSTRDQAFERKVMSSHAL